MEDHNEKQSVGVKIKEILSFKRIITALFLMSLIAAGVLLVSYVRMAQEAASFRELAAPLNNAAPVSEAVSISLAAPSAQIDDVKTTASAEKTILSKYAGLYEQNDDLVGWLKIDGTNIDYPVMYTPSDEQYYIDRDFSGKSSSSGTLFAGSSCIFGSDGSVSVNTMIFGHNMKNGTMFGALMDYRHEAFYKEHDVIQFDTIYEQASYEIIAVFFSQVYNKTDMVFKFYKYINIENEDDFNTYIDNIRSLSIYNCGASAKYGDKLITLVTCAYHVENGRFVVVAKKITGAGS